MDLPWYVRPLEVVKKLGSWTTVELTTNMHNSRNIVEMFNNHKQQDLSILSNMSVPACVSILGPKPTHILAASDMLCTDGLLKALELVKETQETKFVILLWQHYTIGSGDRIELGRMHQINQIAHEVRGSGFQCHLGPSGFSDEDNGCWIMQDGEFEGMESRTLIIIHEYYHGYTNSMMRCTTNLIVIMSKHVDEPIALGGYPPQGTIEYINSIKLQ